MAARLAHLAARRAAQPRSKTKAAELRRLYTYGLTRGLDFAALAGATHVHILPSHICEYLAHREISGGRTRVHAFDCPAASSVVNKAPLSPIPCKCPTRLKADSLRTASLALSSALAVDHDLGREKYCAHDRSGNPVKSDAVADHLRLVREEQAQAGVSVHHAIQLFSPKLRQIIAWLVDQATNDAQGLATRLQYAQDALWYLITYLAIQRTGQVGDTRVVNVAFTTHEHQAFFFGYTWGKTIRDGSLQLTRFDACPEDNIMCPVRALKFYLALAAVAGWDFHSGFLFSPIHPVDATRLSGPGAQAKAGYRFKSLLSRCGIHEGETLHGIRGGAAAEGLLRQAAPDAVAAQAGWKGVSMVEYYTAFSRISRAAGVGASEAVPSTSSSASLGPLTSLQVYQAVNAAPLLTGPAQAARLLV